MKKWLWSLAVSAPALVTAMLLIGSAALAQEDDDRDTPRASQSSQDDESSDKRKSDAKQSEDDSEKADRAQDRSSEDGKEDKDNADRSRDEDASRSEKRASSNEDNASKSEESSESRNASRQEGQGGREGQASQRRTLGVMVVPDQAGQGGVFVQQVLPNSAAARAGLRPGDRILNFDDAELSTAEDLTKAIQELEGEGAHKLTIMRNDQRQTLNVDFSRTVAGFRGAQGDQANQGQGQEQQGRGWIGVMLRERAPQGEQAQGQNQAAPEGQAQEGNQTERGVELTSIFPSGPAARAGLRPGDVVIRVDDDEVGSAQGLADTIGNIEPGEQAKLVVLRNGEEQELSVRVADRNDFFGGFQGGPGQNFPQGGGFFGGFPQQGGSQQGDDSIPEHSMRLEHDRRMAEQHERLESLMREVMVEVQALRREVQQLRGGAGAIQPGAVIQPVAPQPNAAQPPAQAQPQP